MTKNDVISQKSFSDIKRGMAVILSFEHYQESSEPDLVSQRAAERVEGAQGKPFTQANHAKIFN